MKQRFFYIQPLLPSYRQNVIDSLNKKFRLTIITDLDAGNKSGFSSASIPAEATTIGIKKASLFGGRVYFYPKLLSNLAQVKSDDIIFMYGSVKNVSLWIVAIWAKWNNAKFLVHGQGLFKKRNPSFLHIAIYKAICFLAYKYIGYNELAAMSLTSRKIGSNKVCFINNTLELANPVDPLKKTGAEKGVLFVGRLRAGSSIEHLINAVDVVRAHGNDVCVHVIGGGPELASLKEKNLDRPWIYFHGEIYDECKIASIASECAYGCYPGAAGLSIVHYFALSLPVIVHNSLSEHMGPEPFYVIDEVNGFYFDKSASNLGFVIGKSFALDVDKRQQMANAAYSTYMQLQADFASKIGELVK